MESHEASGRLRQLPAYLLELLDAEDRGKLEALLAEDASLRQALVRLREAAGTIADADGAHVGEPVMEALLDAALAPVERRHVLAHLLGCRDCRFAMSILLVARDDADVRASKADAARKSVWRRRLARLGGRWTGGGLAAAAIVAIGIVGVRWGAREDVRASLVVSLDAERAEAGEVSFETGSAARVSLLIETVFPESHGLWQLARDSGETVAAGELHFDPQGPTLRRVALSIPPKLLNPGAYTLVLHSPDAALERQWRFRVTE